MMGTIIDRYITGTIGRVVELHAHYYSTEWVFGLYFEIKVATELSQFMQRFDPDRDGIWVVSRDGCVEGAIFIDGADAETVGAHVRWFIISEELRGQGLGNSLLAEAVQFCRKRDYKQVYLWTFEGLEAAHHLYEKFGFRLNEERRGKQWGKEVLEQRYVLTIS
jgi:GNAT superfamily N-acetyltransferase